MSPSTSAPELHCVRWREELWRLLTIVLLTKTLLLLIDPNLRLFMGDSASYLYAAISDWSPPDRSITYPWLITWSAVKAQSAFSLVLFQTLMGVAGCLLVFWMLRRVAGLSARIAGTATLLVAIEPTQLFYERMLMAESAGLLALLSMVAATVAYVHRGQLRWFPAIAVAGILAVSFRMSLLPVVLGLTTLAPILRLWQVIYELPRGQRRLAVIRAALDFLLLGSIVLGVHGIYQHVYGSQMNSAPSYMVAEGQMRLGLLAPLIRAEHFELVGLPPDFADDLDPPISDHRNREAQMWSQDGLWAKLETELGFEQAQEVAGELSAHALHSNPLALLRISAATVVDYFDDDVALWRLTDDFGKRAPDAGTIHYLAEKLRFDGRNLAETPGLVGHLFLSSRWWLTLVLFTLTPVALACLALNLQNQEKRAVALTVGFAALGLVASHLLFSHIVSFRYLHPLPVFLFATGALCLGSRQQTPSWHQHALRR